MEYFRVSYILFPEVVKSPQFAIFYPFMIINMHLKSIWGDKGGIWTLKLKKKTLEYFSQLLVGVAFYCWDDKTVYLKKVKCSGEHKNIHCCHESSWELQGSVSMTSLQIDMLSFFSTKSDLLEKKNEESHYNPKLRCMVLLSQGRFVSLMPLLLVSAYLTWASINAIWT